MAKGKEPGVGSPTWWDVAEAEKLWVSGRPMGLFVWSCPCDLTWTKDHEGQGILGVGDPRTPGLGTA